MNVPLNPALVARAAQNMSAFMSEPRFATVAMLDTKAHLLVDLPHRFVHAPAPLQASAVPQAVATPGYTHAPAASQVVAPQVPPVTHAAVQQWPWQTPLAHWSGAKHTAPAACFGTHAALAPGFGQ
jgi:hypothetical protein